MQQQECHQQEVIQQEIAKMMKGKQVSGGEQVNFTQIGDFAGNVASLTLSNQPRH